MFFDSQDLESAERDYKALIDLAVRMAPPCRGKVHLAQYDDAKFVTAFIYPAEYDDDVSSWLIEGDYKTAAAAEAGTSAVQRYYDSDVEIIQRHQLFAQADLVSRTGDQLLLSLKLAVQIAEIPEHIRGFDTVKDGQLESAKEKEAELLDAFRRA